MIWKIFEEEYGIWEGFTYKIKNLPNWIGINNSPFVTNPVGLLRHPAYSYWKNMLTRCACIKLKEREPTYKEVTCCEEWLYFTKWFKDNYIKGWQLDKDILVKDNKVYSPDTCIFIPQEINKFLTLSNNSRGLLPIGVTLHQGKFQSRIRDVNLGTYSTKEEAHQAWQKAKLEQAIAFNFQPLQSQLTYEIENNLETISL